MEFDVRVAYSVMVTSEIVRDERPNTKEEVRFTFRTREEAEGFQKTIPVGCSDPPHWSSRVHTTTQIQQEWVRMVMGNQFQLITLSKPEYFRDWNPVAEQEKIRQTALAKLTQQEKEVLGLLSKK
jgi:hypothetical protein